MGDFLRFEVMITPILIQILFWIFVVAAVISGIVMIVTAEDAAGRVGGLLVILLGPIAVRIYAEILIVLFRINDHLRRIQQNTERP